MLFRSFFSAPTGAPPSVCVRPADSPRESPGRGPRYPRDLKRLGLILLLLLPLAAPLGCGSRKPRETQQARTVHTVAAGENLYRIGLRYGVPAQEIARANGIRDVTALRVGQNLVIPRGSATGRRPSSRQREAARRYARQTVIKPGQLQFAWPVRGRLSSRFGKRDGRPHEGVDLAASKGTAIFSAEAGRVIHSGRLGSYGLVVIVKHAGSYRTVYAHASRLLVKKGAFVERGQKIAEVGSTGRSTGPHLHFEIRRSEMPQDPLAYLPRK